MPLKQPTTTVNRIPMIGIMSADEMEDYLEQQDPKVTAQIRKSTGEYLAGRSRPAEEFLAELKMKAPFSVRSDTHFEHMACSLRIHSPVFDDRYAETIQILKADPPSTIRLRAPPCPPWLMFSNDAE